MIPASFLVLFGVLAIDRWTREEGRGSARPSFERTSPSQEEVVLARAISVDLVEVHKRGELDRYNAMRDFVDRSFSLVEFESDSDPASSKSHHLHLWIFLPSSLLPEEERLEEAHRAMAGLPRSGAARDRSTETTAMISETVIYRWSDGSTATCEVKDDEGPRPTSVSVFQESLR